ncbi:MAG: dihydrofolate reductase family protein [Terriglobales bacterium]
MSAPARLLRTLWEAPGRAARPALPPGLRALYGGDLALPRRPAPYVYANFVASADGVVSYSLPGRAGGGTVSGGDRGDRFTMGLLRALADAVIVGGSTLRAAGRRALWTPGFTFPAAAAGFRRLRQAHGLAPAPLLVVVSASGLLPLDYDVFHAPGGSGETRRRRRER